MLVSLPANVNNLSTNPETTAMILATHGSTRDARINRPMFELAEQIRQASSFARVTPAFLDGKPDVRTITAEIDEPHLLVVPFMASAGYYTDVVFRKAFSDAGKTTRITPPIGVHPMLPRLVRLRLAEILSTHAIDVPVTVVVVGHGTRRNKNSCRSTIELVKQLRQQNDDHQIQFAFIDQNPAIDHVASRISTPICLVIPFLMGLGPHLTIDVPHAFGLKSMDDKVFSPDFEFPWIETVDSARYGRRTIVLDAPVGIYPEWVDICVELANNEWTANRVAVEATR